MPINLHLYPSPITHESRIQKATKSLSKLGAFDEIQIVGLHREGLPEHETWDGMRTVWRVPCGKPWPIPKLKSLSLSLRWAASIIRHYYSQDISIVQCHSLDDLPIGVLLRLTSRRRRLLYDPHELETERNGLKGINRWVARIKENIFIRFADDVTVVSQSILDWYKEKYNLGSIHLVRNVPYNDSNIMAEAAELDRSHLRKKFDIKKDEIVFLYQGAFMKGRCIDLIINAFTRVAKDRHVVFMGYGEYFADLIKEYASKHSNIHYHEAVRPDEVRRYTVCADVGLCMLEPSCLNHQYALPNKLFEYTMAGIPLIASNFTEMTRIISELGNGWIVDTTADALAETINQITTESIDQKRLNLINSRDSMGWHNEEKVLLGVYQKLLTSIQASKV